MNSRFFCYYNWSPHEALWTMGSWGSKDPGGITSHMEFQFSSQASDPSPLIWTHKFKGFKSEHKNFTPDSII